MHCPYNISESTWIVVNAYESIPDNRRFSIGMLNMVSFAHNWWYTMALELLPKRKRHGKQERWCTICNPHSFEILNSFTDWFGQNFWCCFSSTIWIPCIFDISATIFPLHISISMNVSKKHYAKRDTVPLVTFPTDAQKLSFANNWNVFTF